MAERVDELPEGPLYVVCVGRKGQGKSELAYALWSSWGGDRLVIDTTGDFVGQHPEPETITLEVPPPSTWPEHLKEAGQERLSLRYVPDHAAVDWREDMDRASGLAFAHGDCLLVVEETGWVAPAGQTLPHTRQALHMGRHQRLWRIDTMPRPMGVDPLVLAQADVIYAFDLPNPDDRKRLADTIGWDRREVDDAFAQLADHEHLRFVAKTHELALFPPLPLPKRRRRIEKDLEAQP